MHSIRTCKVLCFYCVYTERMMPWRLRSSPSPPMLCAYYNTFNILYYNKAFLIYARALFLYRACMHIKRKLICNVPIPAAEHFQFSRREIVKSTIIKTALNRFAPGAKYLVRRKTKPHQDTNYSGIVSSFYAFIYVREYYIYGLYAFIIITS